VGQAGYGAQDVEREKVIPLPEEELKVGKRATETVKHIRTYVVEEPVQKDVRLRDERTVIERRPATGDATGQLMEREYEVRELHEEPVVQKDVRAGEELVVRKEGTERTESRHGKEDQGRHRQDWALSPVLVDRTVASGVMNEDGTNPRPHFLQSLNRVGDSPVCINEFRPSNIDVSASLLPICHETEAAEAEDHHRPCGRFGIWGD
jgi:hypothetical protein